MCMLFSLLFIFMALSQPLKVHASEEGGRITQLPNLTMYSSNEDDESSNETAGYLFWAASGQRTGVLFYVIDNNGEIRARGVLLDKAGQAEYGLYADKANVPLSNTLQAKIGWVPDTDSCRIRYRENVGVATYSGGWQSTGSNAMDYLTSIKQDENGAVKINIKGNEIDCPVWAYEVFTSPGGVVALEELAYEDTEWQVILEPVSVNYLYTDDTFATETTNNIDEHRLKGGNFAAGSPKPLGQYVGSSFEPQVFLGTGFRLLSYSCTIAPGGGRYTYKFYNKQLPYSLCLAEDIEIPYYTGGTAVGRASFRAVPIPYPLPRLQGSIQISGTGIAMAALKIDGISLPPIHTFDGSNTPGNTEPPDPEKGTAGECTIKKLYYTETLFPDGTVDTTASKDYHYYTRTDTSNYISIDPEEGYEIEGWRCTTRNTAFQNLGHWRGLSGLGRFGHGAGIIKIQRTDDERFLYVLYKKTVVNENPPQDWDFQLLESQITKRVSFTESSTTSALLSHQFKWKSSKHDPTTCKAHGGNGHHLNCSKTWDVEPVAGVAHTCTDSCADDCSKTWDTEPVTGVAHTHGNACYDTPCNTFKFTDKEIKLGIKLDTGSINKAVISKKWSVIYNDSSVNTIVSGRHYGEFRRTTKAASTMSKSSFNLVAVLFRGQDHLTLAKWKNNAAGKTMSYLTNIAYDSTYNFKAANTPQGARKAGEEYTETTATTFTNNSPDRSTTYYATVGAYGTCGSTKRYVFQDDYTISGIKVNIKVFWANGVAPYSSLELPSSQTAGSIDFYPYIKMRYDNNTQKDVEIYVLGQNKRNATFYDYATTFISGGDKKLVINSNQWSTHAKAQTNILNAFSGRTLGATDRDRVKASVLPGGATLSIAARSNNTRKIIVKTIQAYLTGTGKTQVDSTGGTNTLPTDINSVKTRHTNLVNAVSSKASTAYIAQYISTGAKLTVSEMSGAQMVKPGETFTANNTTFSTDSKYHFGNYADSKLNVYVNNPAYTTYTFYTDTEGNVRCTVGNTSPGPTSGTIVARKGSDSCSASGVIKEINDKTGVVTALRRALVDNVGEDTEAAWAADGKWYNEAFDGVTYLYAVSQIDIGIWDPLERTTVLDPKETPLQANKSEFFTKFNSAYFRSTINGGPTVVVGTFINNYGSSRELSLNFGELYESDVFYIPNVTTQDLK